MGAFFLSSRVRVSSSVGTEGHHLEPIRNQSSRDRYGGAHDMWPGAPGRDAGGSRGHSRLGLDRFRRTCGGGRDVGRGKVTSVTAALYVRVSTKEQTTATQEHELRRWADRLGLAVARVYADTASGTRSDRAALAEVLAAAHRREFDVLLIWSLDRLSREGIGPMTRYVERLRAAGVRVQSHQEPWLDTGGAVGDLLLAIFSWIGEQERRRIGERVRAGQARARTQGVRFGRKPRLVDLEELRRRRSQGQGWRRIAKAMKTPTSTLRRRFQQCQKSPGESRQAIAGLAGLSGGPEGRNVS